MTDQIELDRTKQLKALNSATKEDNWLEANVQIIAPYFNIPKVLGPLVENSVLQKHLFTWHFLREDECWKGLHEPEAFVLRVRFHAKNKKSFVKVYDIVDAWFKQMISYDLIRDFYYGCHGIEGRSYYGEADDFNEAGSPPLRGWNVTKNYLRACSEMSILLLQVGNEAIKPGLQTHFYRMMHFFANQMGKREWTIGKGTLASSFFVVPADDKS